MNNTELFSLSFGNKYQSKEEALVHIGEFVYQHQISVSSTGIIEEIISREKIGNTMIAEHVLLPHIQSTNVQKSHIAILRTDSPISYWSEEVSDIRLLIVILLKEQEKIDIMKKIQLFVRSLADDDFIEELLSKDIHYLTNKINKILED